MATPYLGTVHGVVPYGASLIYLTLSASDNRPMSVIRVGKVPTLKGSTLIDCLFSEKNFFGPLGTHAKKNTMLYLYFIEFLLVRASQPIYFFGRFEAKIYFKKGQKIF